MREQLEKLNLKQIKTIIRANNLHTKIRLGQKKADLINDVMKLLTYDEGLKKFKIKNPVVNTTIPEPKTKSKPKPKPKTPKPTPKPKPKPKPKPTPKPKEPIVPKSEFKDFKKIAEEVLKFSRDEPVNFICYSGIANFVYLYILSKHKNDCVVSIISPPKERLATQFVEKDGSNLFTYNNAIGVRPSQLRDKEDIKKLIEKYFECAKRNKLLAVPFNLPGHQNMLIFNHKLNQLERYEPHGIGTQGQEQKSLNKSLEKLANEIRNTPDTPNTPKKFSKDFKYRPSIHTCMKIPPEFKKYVEIQRKALENKQGLQSYDGTEEQQKQQILTAGRLVKDPGGFCCMWSFLYMDYRLSNPTLPENELGNEMVRKFKDNPEELFRKFIRGYTFEIMKKLEKLFGGEENLVALLRDKGYNRPLMKKFNEILQKMWVDSH